MFWRKSKEKEAADTGEEKAEGLSRRDLLFGGLRGRQEQEPEPGRRVSKGPPIPILRPPGAVEEGAFLSLCTSCGDCLSACPHDAVKIAPPRFKSAAGTPMIDPFAAPCWNCEDAPCIAACETGALDPRLERKIGIARLQTYNCLAHTGSFCTVCFERCPLPGAIELKDNRPQIVADACTGCGVCHSVCPAPANAIMIMPLFERPAPPPEEEVQSNG